MNYGLYLSASGVLTNIHRQDVYANNLANAQTVGFKPHLAAIRQRSPESVEDQFGFDVSKQLLDRLGGGVLTAPTQISFKPGNLTQTGSEHDLALVDRDTFFAVGSTDPNTGEMNVRLTRDGRFDRDEEGFLVLPSGHQVLDRGDEPIQIEPAGPFAITDAGLIMQNNEVVGEIQVARVANLQNLKKTGQNLFAFEGADPRTIVETPHARAGYLEASGVDSVMTLMKLINATKAATGNANMIRYHDLLMDRAINQFGRTA